MTEINKQFCEYQEKINQQRKEVKKRIIGLDDLIDSIFICFYSHSEAKLVPHLLVEGKVGVGKTATAEAFTKTIAEADFCRIQFAPDMRPEDLKRIVEQRKDRTLEFYPGPLFANLVLADEINRTPEKTRAPLLEAMGEEQLTIGKTSYPLDKPFFVIATENPTEVEGIFPLGAANLDRFMMKVYPQPLTEEEEIQIAELHQKKEPEIKTILTKREVLEIREFIRKNVFVSPSLRRCMVRIVRALRPEGVVDPTEFFRLPEGERGYLFLERATKTRAFLQGRRHVILDDIEVLAFPVLNHRIEFKFGGDVRKEILKAVRKVREDEAKGL